MLLLNNGTRLGSTFPYPDNVNYVRGGQIQVLRSFAPSAGVEGGPNPTTTLLVHALDK